MTAVKRAFGFADVLGAVDGGERFAVDVHRPGIFRTNSVAPQSDDVPLRTVVWSWGDAPAGIGVDPDSVLTLSESVRWDRRDPAGTAGGGIKQVCFVARRADVPRAEFERRYAAHADIARVHHPAVSRYVQNLVVDSAGGFGAIEAISELWFDTVDDYREHYYAGPGSPDVVRTDVVDYLDFTRGFNVMMETRAE